MEDWTTWVRRVTHKALQAITGLGIREWVDDYQERKAAWMQKLTNMPKERWARTVYEWAPDIGSRRVGHPNLRWGESLTALCERQGRIGRFAAIVQERAPNDVAGGGPTGQLPREPSSATARVGLS